MSAGTVVDPLDAISGAHQDELGGEGEIPDCDLGRDVKDGPALADLVLPAIQDAPDEGIVPRE